MWLKSFLAWWIRRTFLDYNSIIITSSNKHYKRGASLIIWFMYFFSILFFFSIYTFDLRIDEKSVIDMVHRKYDEMDDKFLNIQESIQKASWAVLNVKEVLLDQPKATFERLKLEMGMEKLRDRTSLDISGITPFTRNFIYTLGTNVMACKMKYQLEHLQISDMTLPLIEVEKEMTKITNYYEHIFDETQKDWLKLEAKRNGGKRHFGVEKYGAKAQTVTPIFVQLREGFRDSRSFFLPRSFEWIPDIHDYLATRQPMIVKLSATALAIFTIFMLIMTFSPKVTFPHHWLNVVFTIFFYALYFAAGFSLVMCFNYSLQRPLKFDQCIVDWIYEYRDFLKFEYKDDNELKEVHIGMNTVWSRSVCPWKVDGDSIETKTLHLFKVPDNVTLTIFEIIDEYENEVMENGDLKIIGFRDDILTNFEKESKVHQLVANLETFANSQCLRDNSTTIYDEMSDHLKNYTRVKKEIDEFLRLAKSVDDRLREIGEDFPLYVKESFDVMKTMIARDIRDFNNHMDNFVFKCHAIMNDLSVGELDVCTTRMFLHFKLQVIHWAFICYQFLGFPLALGIARLYLFFAQNEYVHEEELHQKGIAVDEKGKKVKFRVRVDRGTYMPDYLGFWEW